MRGEVLSLGWTRVRVRRERPTAVALAIALCVTMLVVYVLTLDLKGPDVVESMAAAPRVTREIDFEPLEGWCVVMATCDSPQQARLMASVWVGRGAAGYVTDPKKNYHLELRFPTPALAERCSARLADRGLSPRTAPGERADTVLFDRGDDIASFLTMIGASRAMLQFEDLRVRRDSKKRANRMMNCDRANLKRQAGASANLISALEGIDLETLPPDLKSAAELRLENPDTSVAELAALADPPMTKSGLYHRLQRLRAFLEEGAVP